MADWKSALSVLEGMGSSEPEEEQNGSNGTENAAGINQPGETINKKAQKLRLAMERAGRGGKTVTIVRGFTGPDEALEELCKYLKQRLGIGGSVKEGEIILQGDQRPKVVELLKSAGYSNTK